MTSASACSDRELHRLREGWCAWYWSRLAAVEMPAAAGVLAAASIELGVWTVPAAARDLAPTVALLLLVIASALGWRVTATVRAAVRDRGLEPNEHAIAAVLWPLADGGTGRSRRCAVRPFALFLLAVAAYLLAGALLLGRALLAS